jgi:hypothetical protein
VTPFLSVRNTWFAEKEHRWRLLHIALIVLAGAAVYANTLHVPFIFDDYYCISVIGRQDMLDILLHGGPRRVSDLTFALNYRLHGLQLFGYHLVNLSIHLSAAVALYFLIVSALTALRHSFFQHTHLAEPGFSERFIPLAVALLFVLHPLQTQAVTYTIQRYTSLATLFYLLSALCFLRARLAFEKNGRLSQTLLPGALALTAGLLALWSKQIAATLPVMLVVLEMILFRGRLLNRRFYGGCAALLLLVLFLGLIRWHGSSLEDFLIDLRHATSEDHNTSRITYLLTQTWVVATYLKLLVLPFGQNLMPDSPVYTTLRSVPVIAAISLHFSLITAALILFRMSRNNLLSHDWPRGALQRLAGLGIFWFYTAMLVESSIFPIRDVIFEHRIYLPSAGFFTTVAAGTALVLPAWRAGFKLAWMLLAAVCIILGSLTIARNQVWTSSLKLWQDTVNKSPRKFIALASLGSEYLLRNRPDKALPLIVRAIELKPGVDPGTILDLGTSLQGLHVDRTRFTTGREYVRAGSIGGTVDLDYSNLITWESLIQNNLALAYEYLGEPDKARTAYHHALRANPAYDPAWYNLGLLSLRRGDHEQAVNALMQLRKRRPDLADSLAAAMAHQLSESK